MEKPRRITKRKIAEIQLLRAVILLEDEGEAISALTLAGAAEEILGKMVQEKGHSTAFDDWAAFDRSFWDFVVERSNEEGRAITAPDEKALKRKINSTRNELKHNDRGKNVRVEAMFTYEAEEMLLRAIRNYLKLYDRLPRHQRVVNWWENMTL
jgi:hypothetical protein